MNGKRKERSPDGNRSFGKKVKAIDWYLIQIITSALVSLITTCAVLHGTGAI